MPIAVTTAGYYAAYLQNAACRNVRWRKFKGPRVVHAVSGKTTLCDSPRRGSVLVKTDAKVTCHSCELLLDKMASLCTYCPPLGRPPGRPKGDDSD